MQIVDMLRDIGTMQGSDAEVAQGSYRLTAAPLPHAPGEVLFVIWEERSTGWAPILTGRTLNDRVIVQNCRPPAREDDPESLLRVVLAGRPVPATRTRGEMPPSHVSSSRLSAQHVT